MTDLNTETNESIHEVVREAYAETARGRKSCCGPTEASAHARGIGYSEDDIAAVPEEANLGLGCGNPLAIESLQPGEVVVDLGSGAGFDALLAARQVGASGRVIGVDMTDEMLDSARANAVKVGAANVEFRKGFIEALPVEDASVDVVISNCVINLSPDKPRTFQEAYRILKPGGRLMVSDIVLSAPLPAEVRNSVEALVGCVGGAMVREEYLDAIRAAGFPQVEVVQCSTAGSISEGDPLAAAVRDALGGDAAAVQRLAQSVLRMAVIARK